MAGFTQEPFGLASECRNLLGDDLPHLGMIDQIVAGDQHVAKCDDVPELINPGRSLRINSRQAVDGFADDLEIAFDALPEQAVLAVFVQRLARSHLADESGGVADVLQKFERPSGPFRMKLRGFW